MKRRELFKMLATLAATPLVAPIAALFKPKGGPVVPFVASPEDVARLTANDDLFGNDRSYLERLKLDDSAVAQGVQDYMARTSAWGELSTLTSERGVPDGLQHKDMNYWLRFYRPLHSVRSGELS